ncbi:MAG: 4-(cytidine 5'-diphospho)-2-C-methyl-D-erythritol kinase [Clostridia bacterium]
MLYLDACAKINWTLDILGTRADGYHLMDMLMQSVALHDTLWLEPAKELVLEAGEENAGTHPQVSAAWDTLSAPPVPFDRRNLVYRAAERLRERAGRPLGARIRLFKRIPAGAGMGGGSADAAAALIGLNELWGLGLSAAELAEIGLSLGADVPFMLAGGLARVGGIGERLVPLAPAPRVWLVLLQPCDGLSTREVFAAFDAQDRAALQRPQTELAQAALLRGDLAALGTAMNNVLEGVSVRRRPALLRAMEDLCAHGAVRAMMTGSGSVVYGVFEGRGAAERALEDLAQASAYGYCALTCTQGVGCVVQDQPL